MNTPLNHVLKCALFFVLICATVIESNAQQKPGPVSLFDGTSFEGWEGDTEKTWRIENETIIAGSADKAAPQNEFICTTSRYSDFELTLEFRTTGTEKINAGVQFRTERIPDHHEVIGYQADIGEGYYGCLYDESRRKRILASPNGETSKKATQAVGDDGWNSYRIRAVGARIELWLNGIKTVDYVEPDANISRDGVIALQIHGQMIGTIAYRNISITNLSVATPASIDDAAWIAGHWQGDAMGGKFEETWNPPMGGEMIGMFKLVKDDKVVFYELLTIGLGPKKDAMALRLKHFGGDFVGWEEKDKIVEFPFESASKTEVKFKGLRFSRESEQVTDRMKIEVATKKGDKTETLKFDCHRAKD